VVKLVIAIKTKDRSPNKNYVRDTLANLERAGVMDSPHLLDLGIVDSGSRPAFVKDLRATDWPVDSAVRTLHQNAARCIEAVGADKRADYGMVLEDDLDFCDRFLEQVVAWLEDHEVDYPQMYVLGANFDQIRRVAEMGGQAWAYPVTAFYGAQALVWKRQHAAQLAGWLGPDPQYNGVTDHGHDLLLQQWGKSIQLTHFVASAPCMVQHIGNESGIGNRFFQFPWGGRDWEYRRAA